MLYAVLLWFICCHGSLLKVNTLKFKEEKELNYLEYAVKIKIC